MTALKKLGLGLLPISIFTSAPVAAQVIPDSTLGSEISQVSPLQTIKGTLSHKIEGGAIRGNSLFQSFQQFNVGTGEGVYFTNPVGVTNILTRVTGGEASNINGVMGVLGNANLFLINPNGILFGAGARLDVGGSFLGTTANSVKFANGVEFSATTPNNLPLLTLNLPIGLQLGSNAGSVQVQGNGHNLTSSETLFAPYLMTQPERGLAVQPRQTLALVGKSIDLKGGVLSAEGGRVELGAVSASPSTPSQVNIDFTNSGFQLKYDDRTPFGSIELSNRSLVNVSGAPAGSLQVRGQDIRIQDSSAFWSQNRGLEAAGTLNIAATGNLTLTGNSPTTNTRSDILSETLSPGQSGEIDVQARQVVIQDGGGIRNRSFGPGNMGAIKVQASQGVSIYGTVETNNINRTAQIAALAVNVGNSGDILVNTPSLEMRNAGFLVGSAFGKGTGSDITVNADTIVVDKLSYLESGSYGFGQAGNVVLNTRRLAVTDGSRVSTTTFNAANAGNVTVNASESIEVTGGRLLVLPALLINEFFPSKIISAASKPYLVIQQAIGIGPIPSGNAGTVKLTTSSLSITDQGFVSVQNEGKGRGGEVNVTARSIRLDQQGSLNATTVSGVGGDIVIKADSLVLRRYSNITATANNQGDGGNITIDSPVIVGLENSDIVANAIKGKGGNIQINTQSIFGLKYRTALTSENDITASSEFGINGNVQVSMVGINPANALNTLPVDIVDSSRQIADRCGVAKNSSFIATGRGGMPQSPTKRLGSDRSWIDVRSITNSSLAKPVEIVNSIEPIIEANALQIDASGSIALVSKHSPLVNAPPATCAVTMQP